MIIRILNSRHEIHDEIKEIVINYLEKQNAQSHSNMLVVRGVQRIQSVYSECKRVEHIQYPGLWVASMELQALEWIRSQMHHALLPRGLDEHACTSMNNNLVEPVRNMSGAHVH